LFFLSFSENSFFRVLQLWRYLASPRLARTIARFVVEEFCGRVSLLGFCSFFSRAILFPEMADVGGFPAVEEHDAPRAENKRKFDDTGVADELGLRYSNSAGVGGGSDGDAPPVPAVAPVSYNSVAPPMSEFELAKQRAELIAARLVTGAELKRPRTEESSEEQQQQQQNGADRSNGSDFDQAYPGNSRNWTCVMSFAAPELPMYRNQTHYFACLVLVLFFLLLLNLYQSEASSFTSVLRGFFFFRFKYKLLGLLSKLCISQDLMIPVEWRNT